MNERARAEEDLRVIRNLMERATIYRAISAPTAVIGGLLAVGTSAFLWFVERSRPALLTDRGWTVVWLVILGLVLAVNALFVRREAQLDGRPFLSSGARLALRSVAPCLVIPAATTLWFFRNPAPASEEVMIAVWIAFYGLSLLATAHFAPRSLVLLGWAFLLTSLLFFRPARIAFDPNLTMGGTFGLYHLLYAAGIWSRRRPEGRAVAATE